MQRTCNACGKPYQAQRSTSKFCSSSCRARAAQGAPIASATPIAEASGGLSAATERELRDAGRFDTILGQQALALARRIESPAETGASVASMSKEFRAVMAEALDGVNAAADPLDELRLRRDRRRSSAS